MLLMKIIFAILIIICAIFYIMYIWNFALVLLAVMIAIPVIMFLSAYIAKRKMQVYFTAGEKAASKNENFPIQLTVVNDSIFHIGKAEATIEYYNVFNDQINSFELHLPVQAKNSQSTTFQLSSKYCGIIKVRCAKLCIYDPLRIFRFRIGKDLETEVAVLPEGHELGGIVSFTDRINEESSIFSEHRPGDDPSEVFDLRDYHPGDKLNRIHWKLSSKKDQFIVKDYSLPVDVPSTLFINMKCYEDSQYTLPVFDTMVETLVSISQFLLENERVHSIAYYSGRTSSFKEAVITDTEALAAAVKDLILSISDDLTCEDPQLYFDERPNLALSSLTFITQKPGDSILSYIDENVDADIKNAVVVVNTPDDAAAFPDVYPEMRIMPVVIGRISSSIKDIEL